MCQGRFSPANIGVPVAQTGLRFAGASSRRPDFTNSKHDALKRRALFPAALSLRSFTRAQGVTTGDDRKYFSTRVERQKKILLTTGNAVQYYVLSSERLSSCLGLGDVR
jgi:hypothetical protein